MNAIELSEREISKIYHNLINELVNLKQQLDLKSFISLFENLSKKINRKVHSNHNKINRQLRQR